MYETGRGVEKNYIQAVRLYRLAGSQGCAIAMHNLGYMYEHGLGVAMNVQEAARLYQVAEDHGYNPVSVPVPEPLPALS